MAVRFRKFDQLEYENFKGLSIKEYAKSLAKSGIGDDKAFEAASNEFNYLLSKGLETPDNYLFSIVSESNDDVGYLWYHARNDRTAFLCDLFVYEGFRRKGYATQALELLEREARQNGCDKIVLNVFDYNIGANELYKKCGYEFFIEGQKGCRLLKKSIV